jgi:MEKHLA domain
VDDTRSAAFADIMISSHLRYVGRDLYPPAWTSYGEAAKWLYEEAPFGLLAHDTGGDPLFVYANMTAQRCFEYGWDEFVGLASRLSAEPDGQEDREALLHAVAEHHFADGYRGMRVAKSGRRFWIEDVTMWDLVDASGTPCGQAAVFRKWPDA